MELRLNLTDTRPLNSIWTFGGNTCHAPLLLREDLGRHLAMAARTLGFRYVRCHGLLSDNMGVVVGKRRYDFSKIDTAIEALLMRGLKPFMELSCMPRALARQGKFVCHYRFYSSPPRHWQDWYHLIAALMRHLQSRFGRQELRQWYFEVWNEPDIPFWSGTQREYFKLYDLAARAIKETDQKLRVGGPATARTNWIAEFLDHVRAPSRDFPLSLPRCDFVSTHAYPSDLEFLDSAVGTVRLQNSNIMGALFRDVRRKVTAAFGPDFPVICGEWNSSAGPYAVNHDDCNNAAFVVKTAVELAEFCQGSLFWNISDIYEEGDFHHEPFHGGYGLITVNDIPKAAFHGFALLRRHRGVRVAAVWSRAVPGVGALVTCADHVLRITAYHYREPDATAARPVRFRLRGLPPRCGPVRQVRVLPGRGSACEAWRAMGRPMFANQGILAALERASRPETGVADPAGTFDLPDGSILHLTIKCRA
jgi:xylan 1,4-beta-xylosidase